MKSFKSILIIVGGLTVGLLVGHFLISGTGWLVNSTSSGIKLVQNKWPNAFSGGGLNFSEKDLPDISIPDQGKVLVVNLNSDTVSLFEDGLIKKDYPILFLNQADSKLNIGKYEILVKKENLFLSGDGIWLPWSLEFSEKEFIGGWPNLPDGTPVNEKYHNEGIRLATNDAREIFDFVQPGTPVVVRDEGISSKDIQFGESNYLFKKDYVPALSSQSFLVGDAETGEILISKNADSVYPIASISKLMTAIVSLETVNQFKEITLDKNIPHRRYKGNGFSIGDKLEFGDLIYPLLIESSNQSAEIIADFAGRENFISNMNSKSADLGLKKTFFEDSSGLSSKNVSTAEDLFKLARYIYFYKSFILDVTRLKEYTLNNSTWVNTNKFSKNEDFIGGKDGYIEESKQTLMTIYRLSFSESDERHLIIVVLRSNSAFLDTNRIISYLQENVVYKK